MRFLFHKHSATFTDFIMSIIFHKQMIRKSIELNKIISLEIAYNIITSHGNKY